MSDFQTYFTYAVLAGILAAFGYVLYLSGKTSNGSRAINGGNGSRAIGTAGRLVNVQVKRDVQTLKLADDLIPLVLDGSKKATIRNGRRDVKNGLLIFEATDNTHEPIEVMVTSVNVMPLRDVPDDALKAEGLSTVLDLVVVMKRFYPDITLDSEVTVIKFNYQGWALR